MSIPVMGVPIVNTPYWLYRLIMSVDYPVDEFVVINNNGRDQITKELDTLKELSHRYIKKITVCHMPRNIGCAGAWNLIIKCYMTSPYWIISNHDLCFNPGFLETMHNAAQDEETGIVNAAYTHFDIFLIKDWVVQKYGLFDENLYPAYGEDIDYLMRLILNPIKQKHIGINYLHGEKDYEQSGSQTWRSDLSIKDIIDNGRQLNETIYLHNKWGPFWNVCKPYSYPFNSPDMPISTTTYDLEFLRRKNTGF